MSPSPSHDRTPSSPSFLRSSFRRTRHIPAALALIAAMALAACGDDDPSGPEATIIGEWDITGFVALGTDFIALGMDMDATLTEAGTFSIGVTNDQAEICEGEIGDSCSIDGDFTYTATTITINPGEEGEGTFDYTVSTSSMTWTGDIDGTPVTITFARS